MCFFYPDTIVRFLVLDQNMQYEAIGTNRFIL